MSLSGIPRIRERLLALVRTNGRRLRQRLGRTHTIGYKAKTNLVTEMDRAVEADFLRAVRRTFPEHQVLSEEQAESRPETWRPTGQGWRWILDPVDGTTNYAHGYPHFAISVVAESGGRMVLGAVYNPMLDELFFGQAGRGAWRNGQRLRVSRTRELGRALLATGFPYDVATSAENNLADFVVLARASQAVRRAGSASLDICDLACGRFDGFWEHKLKPWDVAAGGLILQEAGGRMTDLSGRPADCYAGGFAMSNGRIHVALLRALATARSLHRLEL